MDAGRGGASGRLARSLRIILLTFLLVIVSSPNMDHPLSTKRGRFAGIGVAKPEVYFKSLTVVVYFPDPIISPASCLDTPTVVGSGIVTGCIPGRLAAPFNWAFQCRVSVHLRHI